MGRTRVGPQDTGEVPCLAPSRDRYSAPVCVARVGELAIVHGQRSDP